MHDKVKCELCPKGCVIAPGESGECRVRVNINGVLRAVTYGFPVTAHVDPVEKKPFFHYHPGKPILSFATVGCNLHCKGCQNWEISQANPEDSDAFYAPPQKLVDVARARHIPMIAATYSEPLIYYEFTYDTAKAGLEFGIKTAIVSAGYANPGPLKKLYGVVDAATIDIKAFDDQFYKDVCDGGLAPVLNGLVIAREQGAWLEISNLVVPGMNDSTQHLKGLTRWIAGNLGVDTPLHFLRFFPQYRMRNIPPTPVATLDKARRIAMEAGLHYVYIGNVPGHDAENTYCPNCHRLLIKRVGYHLLENHVKHGHCEYCNTPIAGRFD